MIQPPQNDRPIVQSILFLLDESIASLVALEKIYNIHIGNLKNKHKEDNVLTPEIMVTLISSTRDYFCLHLANLFDKRSITKDDSYSLKKYFKGDFVQKLEAHEITITSIKARNSNICHMGKKYVKWPNVEDILTAKEELDELLKNIKAGILTREELPLKIF